MTFGQLCSQTPIKIGALDSTDQKEWIICIGEGYADQMPLIDRRCGQIFTSNEDQRKYNFK